MEQLLICMSLSLIAGLLASRAAKTIRLPAVTSYLVAGLLLGPFFLGRLGLSGWGFACRLSPHIAHEPFGGLCAADGGPFHGQLSGRPHPLQLLAAAGLHDDRHRVLQHLPHFR